MPNPILYTVPEAADLLGLGETKTWELVSYGVIDSIKIGRARRIPRDALTRFVDSLRDLD